MSIDTQDKLFTLTEKQLATIIKAAFSSGEFCGKDIEAGKIQYEPYYTIAETTCLTTLLQDARNLQQTP